MDQEFPSPLFPSLYRSGPPDTGLRHCAGSWGTYDQLRVQWSGSAHIFKPHHEVRAETWRSTELLPLPLLSPTNSIFSHLEPPNPLDFGDHLQNFFWDHHQDVFGTMAQILGEERAPTQDSINKITHIMDVLKYKTCRQTYTSPIMNAYCCLLSDSVHSIPPELLATLVHEELSLQNQNSMFSEANTGGALDFIPFTNSGEETPQSGYLVYPGNGVDKLNFLQVQFQPDAVECSNDAYSFLLKGPIRQISSRSTCGHNCVAVRSPYHCGVWNFSTTEAPRLLQVVSTTEESTCISVSPHVVGEVLVASHSGAAHLWTLGRGMQQIRTEDSNLYFNSRSSWRWCEFSAHPRVILYADRTGVELTDLRVQPAPCHTLFRISQAAECRSGERLLTCRYLSGVHSFHHLISTQYSAYIMDERFPCVPMLKVDHMMKAPPIFCQILGDHGHSTKVLLGSGRLQEVTLLQYSGGGAEACVHHGPVQALRTLRDCLQLLPAQIPHRTVACCDRLGCHTTGLTGVSLKNSASGEGFCVFQLLESGDIFYQILEKDLSVCVSGADTERCAMDRSERETPHVSNHMELQLSENALAIWKKWLRKLVKKHDHVKKSKDDNVTVKSKFQISKSEVKDSRSRVRRLQSSLKKSMSERSLPVGSTEEIVPLTDTVQADTWSDDLSKRLTLSWDSETAWQAWWADYLGMNKEEKTAALRRKRKQEKEARRAARGRSLLALAGSFTFSMSQSELSDWGGSDSGQGQLTDNSQTQQPDSPAPRTEPCPLEETPTNESTAPQLHSQPEEVRTDAPVSMVTETPSQSTPVKPRPLTPRHESTPASQRPREGNASQPKEVRTDAPVSMATETPSQSTPVKPRPLTPRLQSTPVSQRPRERNASQVGLSSQLSSIFSSMPHKPVDFSQNTLIRSQTPSQSTQGRPSRLSQPKKKSRMGF